MRETLGDILEEKFEIPEDILEAIKTNKEAVEALSEVFRCLQADPDRVH